MKITKKIFLVFGLLAVVVPSPLFSGKATASIMPAPSCQYGGCPSFSANNCSHDITPDIAVIQGGVVIEGLKPVAAKKKLDETLAKLEGELKDIDNARFSRLGTIRAAMGNKQHSLEQYVIGERLEIELPVNADIDNVLEKLPDWGVNRFGDKWHQGRYNKNLHPVVLYKASNLPAEVNKFAESCKAQGWETLCRQNKYGLNAHYCSLPFEKIKENLNITYGYINNGPAVIDHNGNRNNMNIQYPWNEKQLRNIKFIEGGKTLTIRGQVNGQFVPFIGKEE